MGQITQKNMMDSVKEGHEYVWKIPNAEQLHIVLLIKLSHRYVNCNLSRRLCNLLDPTELPHIYNTRQKQVSKILEYIVVLNSIIVLLLKCPIIGWIYRQKLEILNILKHLQAFTSTLIKCTNLNISVITNLERIIIQCLLKECGSNCCNNKEVSILTVC